MKYLFKYLGTKIEIFQSMGRKEQVYFQKIKIKSTRNTILVAFTHKACVKLAFFSFYASYLFPACAISSC